MLFKASHSIIRSVSTLSPLAAAFNKLNHKPLIGFSQLFQRNAGLFGYELLGDSSGFPVFRENAIIEADRLVKEALSNDRKQKMVSIFDQLSNCLCKVADMAEFIRIGHPQQRYASAAEDASIAISSEVEKLNTNKTLYNALLNVVTNGDKFETNAIDDHVSRLFLYDFEQSGIHLDDKNRNLVLQLNEYILHVGSYFVNNTGQPRTVAKSQLPESVRNCFHSEGDHLIVTGLFNESDNELVREAAYRIFLYPDDHQEQLLQELLNARLRLATTCGFESFAHRAVKRSIANTPENVWQLLDSINSQLKPIVAKDFEEMLNLKMIGNRYAKSIKPWDVPYYTSAFKHHKYSQNISECAPYFSLGSCMDGLNIIFNSIFGVQFSISETQFGELWNSDVIKLAVKECRNNTILGYIYCDFIQSPTKPQQDCHFTIQGGCELPDGTYQLPIVVLMLSLPPPTIDRPSLLSPHMVDNLFHEMGHAMHSMIARTPYQHITGTRCSTDLAEIPSILMEFYASDARVVSTFAKHYQTGQSIPENLLNDWIKSKSVFMASDVQLQVFYSALDQSLHSSVPLKGKSSTTDVLAEIQNQYYGLPHVPQTAWQLRFGHLMGYGAKYYSYLVSKAVAASIWKRLFINDPFSASAGHIYKEKVLSHGGGKPSKDIVDDVLESDVSMELLANSLIDFIKSSY